MYDIDLLTVLYVRKMEMHKASSYRTTLTDDFFWGEGGIGSSGENAAEMHGR